MSVHAQFSVYLSVCFLIKIHISKRKNDIFFYQQFRIQVFPTKVFVKYQLLKLYKNTFQHGGNKTELLEKFIEILKIIQT